MKIAVITVLLGALSGTAFAGEATKVVAEPKGYVTIQEVPVVVVEAKRWTHADEEAMQHSVAATSAKKPFLRSLLAYVAR
jgi:hypothetical protein